MLASKDARPQRRAGRRPGRGGEDPEDLSEGAALVRAQAETTVGDDNVEACVVEGLLLHVADHELALREAALGRAFCGLRPTIVACSRPQPVVYPHPSRPLFLAVEAVVSWVSLLGWIEE
eukprot:COSAG06_NODE_41_length_30044_cov_24.608382_17_plen_120_part_00